MMKRPMLECPNLSGVFAIAPLALVLAACGASQDELLSDLRSTPVTGVVQTYFVQRPFDDPPVSVPFAVANARAFNIKDCPSTRLFSALAVPTAETREILVPAAANTPCIFGDGTQTGPELCALARKVQTEAAPGAASVDVPKLSCLDDSTRKLVRDVTQPGPDGQARFFVRPNPSRPFDLFEPGCRELVDALRLDLASATIFNPGQLPVRRAKLDCRAGTSLYDAPAQPAQRPLEWCERMNADPASLSSAERQVMQVLRSWAAQRGIAESECARFDEALVAAPELSFEGKKLETLAPLALIRATSLTLADAGDAHAEIDLSPLARATRLAKLVVSGRKIRGLEALAGLVPLTELSLAGSEVVDFSVLRRFPELKTLDVSRTAIADFSDVAFLTKLERLVAKETAVQVLAPLRDLQSLLEVDLAPLPAPLVAALATQPDWRSLCLIRARLEGESLAAQLPVLDSTNALARQWLGGVPSSCYRRWHALRLAQEITLPPSAISDLTLLKEFAQVERLKLAGNLIQDLAPFAALTRLKMLDVSANKIADLAQLAHVAHVADVKVLGNPYKDTLAKRLAGGHYGVCAVDAGGKLACSGVLDTGSILGQIQDTGVLEVQVGYMSPRACWIKNDGQRTLKCASHDENVVVAAGVKDFVPTSLGVCWTSQQNPKRVECRYGAQAVAFEEPEDVERLLPAGEYVCIDRRGKNGFCVDFDYALPNTTLILQSPLTSAVKLVPDAPGQRLTSDGRFNVAIYDAAVAAFDSGLEGRFLLDAERGLLRSEPTNDGWSNPALLQALRVRPSTHLVAIGIADACINEETTGAVRCFTRDGNPAVVDLPALRWR